MKDEREICGTCKFHIVEECTGCWECVNPESDYCTDYTEYTDSCMDYERRE